MNPEYDSRALVAAQFDSTRRALIMLSAQGRAEGGKEPPTEFCRVYWDSSEINGKIHALCEALIAAQGRLMP